MKSSAGILTIAHGKPKYAQQAINLARSIKLRDPDLPLAVATDLDPRLFLGLYDHVIHRNFSTWSGMVSKLEAYALTPFETTLFLDADCLVLKSLRLVFDYFAGQQFAVFGRNSATALWFRSLAAVRELVPSPTYPVFNGGLYYFTQSAQAADVFQHAKALFPHYDQLQLLRNNRKENDEPLFSLAMAQLGLRATEDDRLDVMYASERPRFEIHVDVMAGECWFPRQGRIVRPVVAHFVGQRDARPEYVREALRLEMAYQGRRFPYWHDGVITAVVHGRWWLRTLLPATRMSARSVMRRLVRGVRRRL